jgi:hypothetical protein
MSKSIACGHFLVVLVIITLLCVGCASISDKTPTSSPHQITHPKEAPNGWWAARFKMNWPEGAEPLWYMDLLLAHRVISPVLHQFRRDISLWRFHRRAARDAAGHQFSFIFYASPATAGRAFQRIRNDRILEELKKTGEIINDHYDSTAKIAKPHVEDTSDRSWSPTLQKAWPYFIMGASETWLDLIDQKVREAAAGEAPRSQSDLKALYSEVNQSIDEIWQTEGSHAFLHHLNAIFGYTPVRYYEKRLLTF